MKFSSSTMTLGILKGHVKASREKSYSGMEATGKPSPNHTNPEAEAAGTGAKSEQPQTCGLDPGVLADSG